MYNDVYEKYKKKWKTYMNMKIIKADESFWSF